MKSEAKVDETAKYIYDENDTYTHTSDCKEIIPFEKIVLTYNSQSVQDTFIAITLTSISNTTEVKLVHEFIPNLEMIENHIKG
ncbi:SRPBCC domain-containing protein [Rhodohalobacter sulfatireducens]|uniref:SRPBCC domain-containing protein n=1 Tax=Rhodohalobacter sulfatireducens TaxID=2911366 RepID=UPI0034E24098